MSRVSLRLLLGCAGYLLLLLILVGSTVQALEQQRAYGVARNLAGRQRMLSQRMTQQLLVHALRADHAPNHRDSRQPVEQTMRVFEETLAALLEGGSAPSDLSRSSLREVDAVSPAVAEKLIAVGTLYARYQVGARAILRADLAARGPGVDTILGLESQLLSESDDAVSLLTLEADRRLRDLFLVHGAVVALALLLTLALMRWARAALVGPLAELCKAAEELSLGDLHRPLPTQGLPELRSLSESFERMRNSVGALLERKPRRDRVSMEMADW